MSFSNSFFTSFSSTGSPDIERGTRGGDLVEDVEVGSCKAVAILPVRSDLAFEMEERNTVMGDRGSTGNLGTQEL